VGIPISVVILTYNSELYLEEVLKSVEFAEEVIIYDNGSKDQTLSIARQFPNVSIYFDPNWEGFGKQKQKGVEKARNDWVLVLDSDEVVTSQLRQELEQLFPTPPKDGYYLPRLNNFFGKWVRYGGFYPDWVLRLFNRRKCRFTFRPVHERVECPTGKIGRLKGEIHHYAYRTIGEFIAKQNRYSEIGAKFRPVKAIFAPIWTFLKIYLIRLGFLEGWTGFLLALLYSQYTFWKYVKGKEEERKNPKKEE